MSTRATRRSKIDAGQADVPVVSRTAVPNAVTEKKDYRRARPVSARTFSGRDIIDFTESINQGFSSELLNEHRQNSAKKLLIAAIESFAARGYHGTTTRDIARSAGMSPAALYVHFPSKRDLLFKLTHIMATAMLEDLRRAQARESDPVRRLVALVSSYVRCNAKMHTAVHVVTFEFDVLTEEQRSAIIDIRRQVNRIFVSCLQQGQAAGLFAFENVQIVRLSIMSMCVSVSTWFSAAGPITPEQLAEQYGQMILKMISAKGRPHAARR